MTELDQAIAKAFESEGQQTDANKVYLLFLRTTLFVPVKKEINPESDEPFAPLFANMNNQFFMFAFDTSEKLSAWAGDQINELEYVELLGSEVIAGISDKAFLCLNPGTDFYKEFSPDEIIRLKTIVSRIEQLK